MRLALAAALAVTLATPASAACYVEGLAGGTISHNKLEAPGVSYTIAGDGIVGGVGAGCDFALGGKFFAGPEFRMTTGHVTASFGAADLKSSLTWTGGLRGGYLVNPNTRAYVFVGYQQTDMKLPTVADWTGKGLVTGVGLDIDVMENTRIAVEVDRAQMSGFRDGGADLKPASYSAFVILKYSLPSLFK